jgi:hypothetical protein
MTMMPAMSAAYQRLDRSAVPRATTTLNILNRVGGSIGTALLAVVLQHQITSSLPGGGAGLSAASSIPAAVRDRVAPVLADAFGTTFWWALALAAAGLIPALLLPRRGEVAKGAMAERELEEQAREDAIPELV